MKKFIFTFVIIICSSYILQGQDLANLGEVWSINETMKDGSYFSFITKQKDSTYMACGHVKIATATDPQIRQRGYIVHFDEYGNVLHEYILTPPKDSLEWTDNNGTDFGTSSILSAHITNNGSIFIVGALKNLAASSGISHPNIGGADSHLKNGVWIMIIDQNGNVLENKLDRGVHLYQGALVHDQASDRYAVAGYDLNTLGTFLLRVYQVNPDNTTTHFYDNNGRVTGGQSGYIGEVFQLDNGNYLLGAHNGVNEYSKTTFNFVKTYVTGLASNESCMPADATPHARWSLKTDGGFWATTRVKGGGNLGSIIFEKDANNITAGCYLLQNSATPRTIIPDPPMPLPGSSNLYVGNYWKNSRNYTYLIEDQNPGFGPIVVGDPIPHNASLRTVSFTDGFFAIGHSPEAKGAIVKLSNCANFKVYDTISITNDYIPYVSGKPLAFATGDRRILRYRGATATNKNDVNYKLTIRVETGSVVETATGTTYTQGQIIYDIGGKAFDYNLDPSGFKYGTFGYLDTIIAKYQLPAGDNYTKLVFNFSMTDNYMNGSVPQSCSQGYQFSLSAANPQSTLFSDDIWFFGYKDDAARNSSLGIQFKNKSGIVEAEDYSNVSATDAYENSLSVSTPACNGSFIFYAQHNTIFNSLHKKMEPLGTFEGHYSVADGLASGYIGNNKYVLFSITEDGLGGTVKYYVVDMSLGGYGSLVEDPFSPGNPLTGAVHTDLANWKVGESLELVPKVGTYDEYWLIYPIFNGATTLTDRKSKLVVREIKGNNGTPIIGVAKELDLTDLYPASVYPQNSFYVQSNGTNVIAITFSQNATIGSLGIFDFNPATGEIYLREFLNPKVSHNIDYYHLNTLAFSPSGKYLYVSESGAVQQSYKPKIFQYDISASPITLAGYKNAINEDVATIPNNPTAYCWPLGSIKLGPDNKIYIRIPGRNYMSVIENPNLSFATTGDISYKKFELTSVGKNSTQISTGLTRPWLDPEDHLLNKAPIAARDAIVTYDTLSITVAPLANDTDPDGPQSDLTLSQVDFVKLSDTTLVSYIIDNNNIKFKIKKLLANDTLIYFNYIVKDKSTPVQLCDEGSIVLLIRKLPKISIANKCSFNPSLVIQSSMEGYDVHWQKGDATGTNFTDITGATNETYTITDKTKTQYYKIRVTRTGETSEIFSEKIKLNVETTTIGAKVWYNVEKK